MRKIKEHVDDALAKGAIDSTPENSSFLLAKASSNQKGNYVAPIVLTNVNQEMLTLKEETFGPVMPIMKVASDNEAVALMNDSDYGLTASVWTKDITVGEELIDRIEAGTVFINRCDYPSPVRDISIQYNHWVKLTFCEIGPCLDRLEDIRFGMYPRAARI